jgi:hypothetical protein
MFFASLNYRNINKILHQPNEFFTIAEKTEWNRKISIK